MASEIIESPCAMCKKIQPVYVIRRRILKNGNHNTLGVCTVCGKKTSRMERGPRAW